MSDQTQKIGLRVVRKKKREPTFTNDEKRILIMLVEKHWLIVESKKTDALSSRAKHNEWLLITNHFNAISDHIPRDTPALKTLWDNLKKKAKQTMAISNSKSNCHATGGVPSTKPKEDPNIDKVTALIKTNVQGLVSNIHDSDCILLDNNEDCDEQILNDNETPPTPKSTRHLTTRQRPVLKESEAVALASTKIKTLQSSVDQSKQEHEISMRCLLLKEEQEKEKTKQEQEIAMRCLLLQELQEKEKLKQEREKTEQEVIKKKILLAELEKVTKSIN